MSNTARIDRLLRGSAPLIECEPHLPATLQRLEGAPDVDSHTPGASGHQSWILLQKCRMCGKVRVWQRCCGKHNVSPWVREEE